MSIVISDSLYTYITYYIVDQFRGFTMIITLPSSSLEFRPSTDLVAQSRGHGLAMPTIPKRKIRICASGYCQRLVRSGFFTVSRSRSLQYT